MADTFSAGFSSCCTKLEAGVSDERLKVLSYLLQHGGRPAHQDLIGLSTSVKFYRLKACLLDAVSSANNPFIPGMNLSVALAASAKRALEGERRALTTMQVYKRRRYF